MVTVTPSAVERLKALLAEHPADPIIRVTLKDLDDDRIAFTITLEAAPHATDTVHTVSGLAVAIDANSAPRLDGVTIDYREPRGFHFHHPEQHHGDAHGLNVLNLN